MVESLTIRIDLTDERAGVVRELEGLTFPGEAVIEHRGPITVGRMPEGTAAGLSTVLLFARLEEGRAVVIETTMALFVAAARALSVADGVEPAAAALEKFRLDEFARIRALDAAYAEEGREEPAAGLLYRQVEAALRSLADPGPHTQAAAQAQHDADASPTREDNAPDGR